MQAPQFVDVDQVLAATGGLPVLQQVVDADEGEGNSAEFDDDSIRKHRVEVDPVDSRQRPDLVYAPDRSPPHEAPAGRVARCTERGTVQPEAVEGDRAAAFVDGDNLEIRVSCRPDAGALEDAVPCALATTLEVAEEIGADIYNEVRVRVHAARIQFAPGP